MYCKNISVVNADNVALDAPVILASNHPNSFLDALIIATSISKPIYFLARGDAFNKPAVAAILRRLNMIPIFRLSEGKGNLQKNEATFNECVEVLRQNGIILIFSEGICINEWQLRPLKKGTARLLQRALLSGINNVTIQPMLIAYDTFERAPKNVELNFLPPIRKQQMREVESPDFNGSFTSDLYNRLDGAMPSGVTSDHTSVLKKVFLALPALTGYISQYWYFALWRRIAKKKTKGTVFFDSVLFGCLLLTYPFLVLVVTSVAVALGGSFWWLLLLVMPFTAWAMKEFKA